MKIKLSIVFFIVLSLLSITSTGCKTKNSIYGQALSEADIIPIVNILSDPKGFEGKTVKIEGKITEECPAGGWFMLKDETGIVFVNLHPSYFAIPQAVGHQAIAEGTVKKEGTQIEVTGKGVQLK